MTDDTVKAARDERVNATFPRLAKWTAIPDVEIISHCWNYAGLLQWQISSLIQWPPICQVQLSVCYCPEDDRLTKEVIDWACNAVGPTVAILPVPMDRSRLMRRAIGRNACALESRAKDFVWFADCDMLFAEGCLDAFRNEILEQDGTLYFPRTIGKIPHEHGDRMINAAQIAGPIELTITDDRLAQFIPTRHGRAIGGIQIVTGETARNMGYLPDHKKYQRPADRWMRTREDPIFRRCVGGNAIALRSLGSLRIRHTHYGRTHIGTIN